MASGIVRAGQPVSVPAPTANDHAARKQDVDSKANDSAVVHNTGNETIAGQKTIDAGSGNQWIFNQPLQVAVGSLATHAVRRDDSRLTDARTPTAHKTSHAVGGSDVLSPADIGAQLGLTPTSSKTGAYTAVSGDLVMCDATSGGFTVTLPAAAAGRVVGVKKTDASANAVTIARAGSDTIGAAAATSVTVVLRDQLTILQANGTNWVILDASQPLAALDSRFAAASHSHAGGDITSGTIAAARLPLVPNPPLSLTYGTAPTIDASLGNYRTMTMTGDSTVGGTVSNGTDGQVLRLRCTASGAQRVLTLHANLIRPSHIGSTLTIPSGKKADLLITYDGSTWYVMSAQVYQ